MLSHGGEQHRSLLTPGSRKTLAAHGYIVAAPYHWRANSYDLTVAYLANKLWQRPVDVSLDIDFLLSDPAWSNHIDPGRIGVKKKKKTATSTSPFSRAGGTTSKSPRISEMHCRSTQNERSR